MKIAETFGFLKSSALESNRLSVADSTRPVGSDRQRMNWPLKTVKSIDNSLLLKNPLLYSFFMNPRVQ